MGGGIGTMFYEMLTLSKIMFFSQHTPLFNPRTTQGTDIEPECYTFKLPL